MDFINKFSDKELLVFESSIEAKKNSQENINLSLCYESLTRGSSKHGNRTQLVLKYAEKSKDLSKAKRDLERILSARSYLSHIKYLKYGPAALEILCRNKTIVNFDIECDSSWLIDQNLAIYLEKTVGLQTLNISCSWNTNPQDRLTKQGIEIVAKGLSRNKTLTRLDFSYQPLRDDWVELIIDALRNNPDNKLERLNLFGTLITKKTSELLEKFKGHPNFHLKWIEAR